MELLLLIVLLGIGPLAVVAGHDSRDVDTRRPKRWWPGGMA
jgi:hypothetical protein